MKYFLFLAFVTSSFLNASAHTPSADEDIDFSLTNLTLTAGDEKDFQYTFNLTNSGTSEVQGYSMKLTFSEDDFLDFGDTFTILVPVNDNVAQWIGPNQTLLKTEHYYATLPMEYLPIGSWYVFAEINYDRIVPETDYNNNIIRSTNKITVNSYTIPFTKAPTISDITENSFHANVFFDGDLSAIYYKVQANGILAPNRTAMLAANMPIFPWEGGVTVSGLGPAFEYDVYFMGEFPNGRSTGIHKIDVTTLGTVTPTLKLSATELAINPVNKNSDSAPVSYVISGFHLTANVVVSGAGQMVVSKDDVTYSAQVTFPPFAFDNAAVQTVYVKYLTDGSTGVKTENITNASAGATDHSLPVSVSVFDPANGTFNDLTKLEETGWSAFSIAGPHAWSLVDLASSPPDQRVEATENAMQIDGALDGFTDDEDWLISPEINLSGFEFEPTIRFKSYSSGQGSPLKLKYSANYSGTGDPRSATWFDADGVEFPAVDSKEWKNSTVVVLNKESKIFFAFVYTSTATDGTRWTIDDWSLKDNLLSIPSTVLSYADVEVGTSSEAQSMLVKIAGYGDITVAASESFELSLDNATFKQNVIIPESQSEAGATIYVRFTPATQTEGLQGTLTFTGSDLSVAKNNLVGTSLFATAIAKPFETTNFIFPNPTNGPVHIDANAFYAQLGDIPVLISNSMGSSVANFSSSSSSLETNLSDAIATLEPGLYYITIQTDKTIYRNKLVRE